MYDAVGVAHHVYALQRLVGMQHAEAVVAEGVTEFELVQQRVVLNGVEMHGAVRQVDFVKLLFLRISHVVENRSVRGSSLHALGHQPAGRCQQYKVIVSFCLSYDIIKL